MAITTNVLDSTNAVKTLHVGETLNSVECRVSDAIRTLSAMRSYMALTGDVDTTEKFALIGTITDIAVAMGECVEILTTVGTVF